jgi:hypothetical protein
MSPDEFLRRAAAQPPVEVEQKVRIPGPELRALYEQRPALPLSELMAHPDQREEVRECRYGHVLGAGLPRAAVDTWQAEHSEYVLPRDLVELLERANGIHLWADLETKRADFGILPLEEWQDAACTEWAELLEEPPVGQLVLSYHDNGDFFLALDTRDGRYLRYDPQDIDYPEEVGSSVSELLDFWWDEAAWLDPARTEET